LLALLFALGVELEGLFPHHGLEELLGRLEVVPGPVEGILALGLSLLVVQAFEVGVLETLFDGVPFLWVEYQHFTQQVERHGVGLGVQARPTLLVALQ